MAFSSHTADRGALVSLGLTVALVAFLPADSTFGPGVNVGLVGRLLLVSYLGWIVPVGVRHSDTHAAGSCPADTSARPNSTRLRTPGDIRYDGTIAHAPPRTAALGPPRRTLVGRRRRAVSAPLRVGKGGFFLLQHFDLIHTIRFHDDDRPTGTPPSTISLFCGAPSAGPQVDIVCRHLQAHTAFTWSARFSASWPWPRGTGSR